MEDNKRGPFATVSDWGDEYPKEAPVRAFCDQNLWLSSLAARPESLYDLDIGQDPSQRFTDHILPGMRQKMTGRRVRKSDGVVLVQRYYGVRAAVEGGQHATMARGCGCEELVQALGHLVECVGQIAYLTGWSWSYALVQVARRDLAGYL